MAAACVPAAETCATVTTLAATPSAAAARCTILASGSSSPERSSARSASVASESSSLRSSDMPSYFLEALGGFLKLFARTAQAALDGALGHLEQLGQLVRLETLELEHHEHQPRIGRHALQRGVQILPRALQIRELV